MEVLLRCRTLGIQARLLIPIVVTVLPLIALASFTVLHTVDNERARVKRDLAGRVEDLLADVDRQIRSMQAGH